AMMYPGVSWRLNCAWIVYASRVSHQRPPTRRACRRSPPRRREGGPSLIEQPRRGADPRRQVGRRPRGTGRIAVTQGFDDRRILDVGVAVIAVGGKNQIAEKRA